MIICSTILYYAYAYTQALLFESNDKNENFGFSEDKLEYILLRIDE